MTRAASGVDLFRSNPVASPRREGCYEPRMWPTTRTPPSKRKGREPSGLAMFPAWNRTARVVTPGGHPVPFTLSQGGQRLDRARKSENQKTAAIPVSARWLLRRTSAGSVAFLGSCVRDSVLRRENLLRAVFQTCTVDCPQNTRLSSLPDRQRFPRPVFRLSMSGRDERGRPAVMCSLIACR